MCWWGQNNHQQDHFYRPMDTYLRRKLFVPCVAFVKHCGEIGLITNGPQKLVCQQISLNVSFYFEYIVACACDRNNSWWGLESGIIDRPHLLILVAKWLRTKTLWQIPTMFFNLFWRWKLFGSSNSQLPTIERKWRMIIGVESGIGSLDGWRAFYSMSGSSTSRHGPKIKRWRFPVSMISMLSKFYSTFGTWSALKLWGMDCTHEWAF